MRPQTRSLVLHPPQGYLSDQIRDSSLTQRPSLMAVYQCLQTVVRIYEKVPLKCFSINPIDTADLFSSFTTSYKSHAVKATVAQIAERRLHAATSPSTHTTTSPLPISPLPIARSPQTSSPFKFVKPRTPKPTPLRNAMRASGSPFLNTFSSTPNANAPPTIHDEPQQQTTAASTLGQPMQQLSPSISLQWMTPNTVSARASKKKK